MSHCYIPRLSLNWTGTAIGWLFVTWLWLKSNVSRSWYIKQCTPLGIYYSKWSEHGGKWRDRRREKHCQFSFSWMNATTFTITQTWSLKLKSNDFQQLVEEKDADNIRKVLFKSFIQWLWELNLCSYKYRVVLFCCCWSTLEWKSRNITKHLMSGPSGKLVLFSLQSWCFPRLRLGKHIIRTLGKTELTVFLGIWH